MIIKKRITVEIEVDDLNHKHCAHTITGVIRNKCPRAINEYTHKCYCDLFGEYLKENFYDYPIRCDECLKKFGLR